MEQLNIPYEDVFFETENNLTLHGWWLPAQSPKGSVLFVHGNAGNISAHVPGVYWLPQSHYSVFIFDYRGYGKSEGEPSLPNALQDINHAIDFLLREKIKTGEKMIVMGHSIGAALTISAIANSPNRDSIKGVISASSFSDYHVIAREFLDSWWLTWSFQWPLSFTMNNEYSPLKFIAKIAPLPLLIFHGNADKEIPLHHAKRLFNKAKSPKEWALVEGGHNDIFNSDENRKILISFMNNLDQQKN